MWPEIIQYLNSLADKLPCPILAIMGDRLVEQTCIPWAEVDDAIIVDVTIRRTFVEDVEPSDFIGPILITVGNDFKDDA